MWNNAFRILMNIPLLRPVLRPLTRFLVGAIAIPLFRLFLKRVVRLQDLDAELEKDLEQWFRGSLLLLVATRNMEEALFGWVPLNLQGEDQWIAVGFRLLLAIGVIEAMPDQELFAVIHPGPPKLKFNKEKGYFRCAREQCWPYIRGYICQHLNRSSPVFAILAAIAPGTVGWVCYGVAVAQYLIIGLVTSRDKAMDVLAVFDETVGERRRQLVEEFSLRDRTRHAMAAAAEQNEAEEPSPDGAAPPDSQAAIVAKERNAGYVSD